MELYRISNWKVCMYVYLDNNKKLNEMRNEKKTTMCLLHIPRPFSYHFYLQDFFLLIEQNTKYFSKFIFFLPRESTFQLKKP